MPLAFSGRKKVGPFTLHFGKSGLSSVGIKMGPATWRLWSRSQRGGLSSMDLPGPVSYRTKRRPKRH